MKRFLLLYKGPQAIRNSYSKEQKNSSDNLRNDWINKIGNNLVDIGASASRGVLVMDSGEVKDIVGINGYSIIKAENIETAQNMVLGNPYLMDGTGDHGIEVIELD